MSRPESGRELERAADDLRSGRWLSVRRGGDELVLGTRATLTRTKLAFAASGLAAGLGVAALLSGLLATIGWALLALGAVWSWWRLRIELRARATVRQRDRNERGRHGTQARADAVHEQGSGGYAHVSTSRPALPTAPQPSLPASSRALPPRRSGR